MKFPRFRDAFVGYHWLISTITAGIYAAVVYGSSHIGLAGLGPGVRNSFYLSLAATSGVLLGFAITTVAIFFSLGSSKGLDLIRGQAAYGYIRTVLMGAIRALALSTVVMTALILLDTHIDPRKLLEVIAIGVATLALLRTWALLWLLNRLLRLVLPTTTGSGSKKSGKQSPG
jgi:hypothetical protein